MLKPSVSPALRAASYGHKDVWAIFSPLAAKHQSVNLGQGFPNMPAAAFVKDAACSAIHQDINQYAPSRGLPVLLQVSTILPFIHLLIIIRPSAVYIARTLTKVSIQIQKSWLVKVRIKEYQPPCKPLCSPEMKLFSLSLSLTCSCQQLKCMSCATLRVNGFL